jgi:PAB-dependent poly(A)-specific ribonuclease subunit 3
MSYGGHGCARELSGLYHLSPLSFSLSNVPPGPSYQNTGSQLPTIQPAPQNKGAPPQTSTPSRPAFLPLARGCPHANAAASPGSSTTESISGLTSSSSRDSLAAARGPSSDSTPQKQARNYRRKSSKASARWSREGGSSDDTGPDRKPPTSQPPIAAPTTTQSLSQRVKQRQSHPAPSSHAAPQARLMATTYGSPSGDSRRGVVSPRPKARGRKCLVHRVTCSL